MKKFLLFCLVACFTTAVLNGGCQTSGGKVFVSDKVLKTAKWAGFDYKDKVKKAQQGDLMAMSELLKFFGTVDGTERADHAVTCFELIPYVSDKEFAGVCRTQNPNLLKVLREQMVMAATRTQKKELQNQHMSKVFPITWAVLNDMPLINMEKIAPEGAGQSQEGMLQVAPAPEAVPADGQKKAKTEPKPEKKKDDGKQ